MGNETTGYVKISSDSRLAKKTEKEIKNEAIKEFAERLKESAYVPGDWAGVSSNKVISERDVDNLVKEMTEN